MAQFFSTRGGGAHIDMELIWLLGGLLFLPNVADKAAYSRQNCYFYGFVYVVVGSDPREVPGGSGEPYVCRVWMTKGHEQDAACVVCCGLDFFGCLYKAESKKSECGSTYFLLPLSPCWSLCT